MNTNNAKVLYIASGRSFFSNDLPRKIAGVINSFRKVGATIKVIAGGDLFETRPSNQGFTAGHHKRLASYPIASFLYHSISELRDISHDRRLRKMIEDTVLDFRPDLIWERSSRLHIAGLQVAQEHGLPFILEWKDNLLSLYGFSMFKIVGRLVERRKIGGAYSIVVESSKLAAMLSQEWCIDRSRFVVAINAVDTEQFYPKPAEKLHVRKVMGLPLNAFVIVYVGNFAWYHNVNYLVEAARYITVHDLVPNALFLMVGDGPGRAASESLITQYSLEGKFRFIGRRPQSEIPDILNACDVAVLPDSLDIVCPIKVQEYMAMELPVILPAYEANAEVVSDKHTGIFFRPQDPIDLAEKICYIAMHPTFAARIGANARQAVHDRFTWEKTWGAALRTILGRL